MRIQLFSWLLLVFVIRGGSGKCLDYERLLLLQLRRSLVFDPYKSTKLVNWGQSDDCCNWGGVECDENSGHVIGLDLENESISGGIQNSSSLFSLQNLEKLNLAFNVFNGTEIPKGLGNLTNLAYLNLSNAGFGGQVPIEVSAMRSLVNLDLSNFFPGVNPLKLENPNLQKLVQNLSRLTELYLDSVNISAQRSDWCQVLSSSLPNLTTLSLRSTGLSGPLDSSLSKLRSLSVLCLSGNNLSTTVPAFFANFSNLTTLLLSNCFLQGYFPVSIFQVSTLHTLDLSSNRPLSGTIREFPGNGYLRTIVLSHTNFSGTLPDSISNLRMLSRIELSNCNFAGEIPSTIDNLTELVYLDFSLNSFTGSIPKFVMSKKLSHIDLRRNNLAGPLSSMHFEGFSNLENINLANNSLSGSIPPSLFRLPSLQKLQLSSNKFSGQIVEFSPSNSSKLDTLDLSSNKLGGSIPKSVIKLGRLNVLSLSSNFFNGSLKLEIFGNLRNLSSLELGHNNLSVDTSQSNSSLSQFPQLSRLNLASCNLTKFPDLRSQSKLEYLDLSNNHIKGEIPSWIWNTGDKGVLAYLNLSYNLLVDFQKPYNISPSLSVIDLHSNNLSTEFVMPPPSAIYVDYSSNYFHQHIPDTIGKFNYLAFFSLANNSFNGTIPASICNAAYLQVLDLSVNNLTGGIPPCLVRKITSLGVLNLRRNSLSGDIPDTFSNDCAIKTLDLSDNNLRGKFPPSMAKCKSLEVMNTGNNKIDDTFPCNLKNASSLRVLVLRNNKFHGDLNCSRVNGRWTNLQIVDIALNNFSGELHPKCILRWRGMMLGNDAPSRDDHLRFGFLNLNNFYYQDSVTFTIKGRELELLKILTVFTAIDISSNNFSGAIPYTIGDLSALYILNLSHNAFTGPIPNSIGNLRQLGSLDLSANQLTGNIPEELVKLTFLSVLNLSYNKLVGSIPTGAQFQTFPAENFAGNSKLCGSPLNTSCDSKERPAEDSTPSFRKMEFHWQLIFTGLGYGIGVALVLAPLAFSEQWREQCDEQVDQFLKLIIPRYGFSYVRYDAKVETIEDFEDEVTDDDDDDDEEDGGDGLSSGRYCLFCTKLDIQIKTAIHNSKCTCHYSPPTYSSSPTLSSSPSLFIYPQDL